MTDIVATGKISEQEGHSGEDICSKAVEMATTENTQTSPSQFNP